VNFTSFVAIRVKVFFTKFEGVASFGGTSEQSIKIFSGNFFFSTNLRKFSPVKVSSYTVNSMGLIFC